jgi:hypothetical protein
LNPMNLDYTKVFEKQPSKEQLQHLTIASNGMPFGLFGTLLIIGDVWSHQFKIELTPEFKKLLKKIK